MDSDDPVQADASTVHRGTLPHSDPVESSAALPHPSGDVASVGEAEGAEIAEAQTVIRGRAPDDSPQSRGAKRLDQTPASVAKVLRGTRLNHFLLEDLIGGGGMGAVFRARDEQLDRTVAIKVIPFVGHDPDLQRRFRNEAQSAAKLDHPQIARVFEVGHYNDWHYIVFEYIRGTNVRDLVNSGGVLSIDDAVFYTCQLAEALQHASDRGIVHRDIKPSNVLIGEDDKIKLVDMGLARSENFDLSEDLTASGVTLGTFDYISPEQARDPRVADLRSDIYSLGCTLYFMLTGSPPYPGGTMLQKLLSHGNAPPPDPRRLRPQVSDDLVIVINKMLAKEPRHRYGSGNDLVYDLREVAFRDGLTRSQGIPAVSVSEPSRVAIWLEYHAPWMIAAALLLISIGWLQLMSAASRDEFDVPIPSTAMAMRDLSGSDAIDDASRASDGSTNLDPTNDSPSGSDEVFSTGSETTATAANSENPGATSTTNSDVNAERVNDDSDSFAAPPRLGTGAAAAELDVDIDSMVFAGASGPRDDNTSDTQSMLAGMTPRVIRVVSDEDFPIDPLSDDEEDIRVGSDSVVEVSTLATALVLAKRYDVNQIEIAAPLIRSGPVRIEQDGLLITASPEVSECVIEMRHFDSMTMERLSMFDIGSNRIEFEDVHFVWKVSGGEFDGGAMMTVSDNRLLRMTDCSITIDNPSRLDSIYAFEVATDSTAMGSIGADRSALPLVAIELNNVIVRGQMTMIHMKQAVELQLQWDNGLLAINQRMIDTMGAAFEPAETASAMQLSLTRLTALIPQGLVRMRLGVGGEYPVSIDREARSCVFVVDDGTPHVEISGLTSFADSDGLLKLRGEANAYDVQPTLVDPFLLRSDNQGRVEVTRMGDLKSDPPAWSDETSQRWSVRWATLRSETALSESATSELGVEDFLQDGTVFSGFDPNLLPSVPTTSVPPDNLENEPL